MAVKLEGADVLRKQFRQLDARTARRTALMAVRQAMMPIRAAAKRLTPVHSRRLRSSIGMLAKAHRQRDGATGRVGFRRDFTFVGTNKQRIVSGAGKKREAGIAKGLQGDVKQVNQYAAIVEFGQDIDGNRRSQGAHMLDRAIKSQSNVAIGALVRTLNQQLLKGGS
jgi:hypothetical protein